MGSTNNAFEKDDDYSAISSGYVLGVKTSATENDTDEKDGIQESRPMTRCYNKRVRSEAESALFAVEEAKSAAEIAAYNAKKKAKLPNDPNATESDDDGAC